MFGIDKIDIVSGGSDYKKSPIFTGLDSNEGKDAYIIVLAAELNRYIKIQKRWFMWALGAVTVTGVKLSDVVNKDMSEILSLTGDLYDQETRLFQQYKEQLKTFAGR